MPIKELKIEHIPRVKQLDVSAKQSVLSRLFEGQWVTAFKGRGLEFAGFRRYQYGDDASLIDWKASLKSKEILIREFEEYKTLNVFFLIDVSNSMLFSSTDKLKCEYAAELVLCLTHAMLSSGDAVGMGLFTDRLVVKRRPEIGRSIYHRMIKDISDPNNYGGKCDIKTAVRQAVSFLKERCLFIIVSDFIDLGEGWEYNLKYLAQEYDLIGVMIRDPRDRELPQLSAGEYILEDPYTGKRMAVDTERFAADYSEYVKNQELAMYSLFRKIKAGLLTLSTDKDFYNPVLDFFHRRNASAR